MKCLIGWSVIGVALVFAIGGCSSTPKLMPTPNLYADGLRDPFPDVPPELQNNKVEVLYLTDRKPEKESTPDHVIYGFGRSRSIAMGVSTLEIGKDVSWSELNAASRTNKRKVKLPLTVVQTRELVRFPPTPKMLIELPTPTERTTRPAATTPSTLRSEVEAATEQCKAELSARLAKTPVKDVYVFVHGYDNKFDDAIETIGQLWHFLGRQGVPVAYTWPAGRGGLLRGYTYDRESSEFTVYHLKEMLRVIASCPDVHKIHIISHSRGTDVAVSALRELHLEFTGAGKNTREELKLKTLILAAPDLDVEVVIQRMVTVHLGRVPEQCAIYVCSKDEALGISNWLFGGSSRLGKIRGDMFSASELEDLRRVKSVQLIDARISDPGPYGHSYFHENAAVSSDLILLVRYGLYPSPERPLNADPKGFWYLTDDYPKYARVPTTAPSGKMATAP
jgi:esterase/lipase superfamily enzyme